MLRLFMIFTVLLMSVPALSEIRNFSFGLPGSPARPAILYVPEAKKTGSLLVVLHGGSRNAKLAMNQDSDNEWNQLAEKFGWFVLYPSGTTNQKNPEKLLWNDCRLSFGNVGPINANIDDVGYLDALIRKVKSDENLKEVFITGHSNGAGMTFRLALESSIVLKGIAPMLMNMPRDQRRCKDHWQNPIPTAFLLGTNDPMVSFKGGIKGKAGTETLEWIRSKNKATFEGKSSNFNDVVKDDGPDGKSSVITKKSFGPSDKETNVIYFEVKGGGHQVPGPTPVEKWVIDWLGPKNRDISIRQEIANFFQEQIDVSKKSP